MIDDEPELREIRDGAERRGNLAHSQQEVVGETAPAERGVAAPNVVAQQPIGVGFVVNQMTYPDETAPVRSAHEVFERPLYSRVGQVDPSDDARDEIDARGGREKVSRLLGAARGLHQPGRVDAVLGQHRAQVFRAKPPPNWRVRFGHPGVLGDRRIPEVLMRVDEASTASPPERPGSLTNADAPPV